MTWLTTLPQRARQLKAETWALYLAARDPRTPWYAKLLVAGIVAYACSPIDLIPDFIPVLSGAATPGYRLGSPLNPSCCVGRVSSTSTSNHPGWETRELGGRCDHCRPLVGRHSTWSRVGHQDREKDGLLMRMDGHRLRRILYPFCISSLMSTAAICLGMFWFSYTN
jgi:hypothetical protein